MDRGMTAKAPPPLEFQFNEKNFYIVLFLYVCQESVQGMLELTSYHKATHYIHRQNWFWLSEAYRLLQSHSSTAKRTLKIEWIGLATTTYRVDLDQVGIPGIARDLDVVVTELTSGSSTIDVSIVNDNGNEKQNESKELSRWRKVVCRLESSCLVKGGFIPEVTGCFHVFCLVFATLWFSRVLRLFVHTTLFG